MTNPKITISGRDIGLDYPTYFIADIAANHDGDLERAKDLIYLAAERGADAAKFQHFSAETIVSDVGFEDLGGKSSHQASWEKSVFEVYQDASVSLDWTSERLPRANRRALSFSRVPTPWRWWITQTPLSQHIKLDQVTSLGTTWCGTLV